MTQSFHRIEDHLGTVLQRLSVLEIPVAAAPGVTRDLRRCLRGLHEVARELDRAFAALKDEQARLRADAEEAETTTFRARKLFGESPNACLVVRREGAAIAEANIAASRLLNVSQRHLIGKPFTNFLQHDREVFLKQLRRTTQDAADQWHIAVRPRERAMLRVLVTAVAESGDTAALRLTPVTAESVEIEASESLQAAS
jgi:hypothetical protein